MALLAAACPDMTRDELLALPIGKRDAMLLELRKVSFGPTLTARTECPQCSETIEFQLDVDSMLERAKPTHAEEELAFVHEDLTFRFRLPDSVDLLAAAECTNPGDARECLIAHCVQDVKANDEGIALGDVPDQAIAALSEFVEDLDPLTNLQLALDCPSCAHSWIAVLEPAEILWTEIRNQASRLLQEIDLLARAYGWREQDVLAMTPARRRLYVGMVTQ